MTILLYFWICCSFNDCFISFYYVVCYENEIAKRKTIANRNETASASKTGNASEIENDVFDPPGIAVSFNCINKLLQLPRSKRGRSDPVGSEYFLSDPTGFLLDTF
jgi:hypothetical protein